MTLFKSFILIAALTACACSQAQTPSVSNPVKVASSEAKTWDVKHVDAAGAKALLASNADVKILDIRTPGETQQGHIDGAIFVDFKAADFEAQLTKLDRTAPYIVHCRSGGRSTKSLATFKKLGFTNITHMDGGIIGWSEAALPLVTP